MTDETRALLIVAVLLVGASGSVGGVIGRATAPVAPPVVRVVPVPLPAARPVAAPAKPIKPAPPRAEVKPKSEVKRKEQPKPKTRPPVQRKTLPSCAVVKREYARMSWSQQMAEYHRATPEQVAHGRRCLGF